MTTSRAMNAAGLAAALLFAGGTGARAEDQTAQKRMWQENFEYRVEIGGAVSPLARLFSTSGRPSMLVLVPEMKRPFVLQTDVHEVFTVNPSAIEKGPVPEQVFLPDSEIVGPPSPYTLEDEAVVFFMEGRKIRMARKPPLIGAATMEDLITQLPAYKKGMEEYAPAETDTVYLKSFKYPVRMEVFFGSWCPHCRELVPRFLKTISVIANENIKVSFVGVPVPPFGDYPPAKEKNIKGVPTIIVYGDDKEVGRVGAIPGDSSVEHELVKVLYQYEQSKG